MKTLTFYLGLVLLLIFPSACYEEEVFESLVSAERTDNDLSLDNPIGDLKRKLEKDLKLRIRIDKIKTELDQAVTPNMKAMQIIGKDILRSRGVDPDTMFAGPDDPRLALVPVMTEFLDSINAEWNKEGYYIESAGWVDKEDLQGQTGNGNSISLTQNISWPDAKKANAMVDCLDQGGALALAGGLLSGAAGLKVGGTVIGTACGINITAGGALLFAAAAYYAFRLGDCQGKVARGPLQYSDKSYLEHCRYLIRSTSSNIVQTPITQTVAYKDCQNALRWETERIIAEAKEKYGDSLFVAVTHN